MLKTIPICLKMVIAGFMTPQRYIALDMYGVMLVYVTMLTCMMVHVCMTMPLYLETCMCMTMLVYVATLR